MSKKQEALRLALDVLEAYGPEIEDLRTELRRMLCRERGGRIYDVYQIQGDRNIGGNPGGALLLVDSQLCVINGNWQAAFVDNETIRPKWNASGNVAKRVGEVTFWGDYNDSLNRFEKGDFYWEPNWVTNSKDNIPF